MSRHLETVDDSPAVGKHTSLALDGDGHPHISYYAHYPYYDLKYTYYSGPQLNWRDSGRLLLPPRGATVDVVYGNIPTLATLTATLSGPTVFADGSQVLTANITAANGSYPLHLKPTGGPTPSATFTLEIALSSLRLEVWALSPGSCTCC